MSITKRYVAVQNTTASKERLMVSLFDAAVRHMRTAIRHIEAKDPRAAMPLLDKASKIVSYLHGTLNRDAAPNLVDSLAELYVLIKEFHSQHAMRIIDWPCLTRDVFLAF